MKDYVKQTQEVIDKAPVKKFNVNNLEAFYREVKLAKKHLSEYDPVLAQVIKEVGEFRLKPHKKYFETLVDAIISQQLSTKAAESILNRFEALFSGSGMKKRFPLPEEIIAMDGTRIRACGLSNLKVGYVKDLASKVLDGIVKIHKLNLLPDEEIINELVQVKGIGVWSAHMFLMFCLARLDVLPVGDLGFRKAVMLNYRLRKMPDEKKINLISKKNNWSPYRSVATWYLWQSLSLKEKK
jgi:DNA-3-methyladenine glycosylase II